MNTLILFRNDGIYEEKKKSFKIGECIKKIWEYKECDELVWLNYFKIL